MRICVVSRNQKSMQFPSFLSSGVDSSFDEMVESLLLCEQEKEMLIDEGQALSRDGFISVKICNVILTLT